MKIDKSFILYILVVFLLISLSFNIKSCRREPVPVDAAFQRKVDSLVFANQQLDRDIKLKLDKIKKSDSIVNVLNTQLSSLSVELGKAKAEVRRQRAAVADNDRKIKAIKDSKVTLSDDELVDFFNKKSPK